MNPRIESNPLLKAIADKVAVWRGGAFGAGKYTAAHGTMIDFFHPEQSDSPTLVELAIAMSQQSRWGGQIDNETGGYSIAAHSLWVAETCRILASQFDGEVDTRGQWGAYMAGLVHDIEEGVCQDLVRPVKHHMGPEYRRLADLWRDKLVEKFGLAKIIEPWADLAKLVDDMALPIEDHHLRGGHVNSAKGGFPFENHNYILDPDAPPFVRVQAGHAAIMIPGPKALTPMQARRNYLDQFTAVNIELGLIPAR